MPGDEYSVELSLLHYFIDSEWTYLKKIFYWYQLGLRFHRLPLNPFSACIISCKEVCSKLPSLEENRETVRVMNEGQAGIIYKRDVKRLVEWNLQCPSSIIPLSRAYYFGQAICGHIAFVIKSFPPSQYSLLSSKGEREKKSFVRAQTRELNTSWD